MLYSPTRINPHARKTLLIAAVLMLTGVALGAFGAHGLKKMVAPHLLETWETGARYWLLHGLALLALGSFTLNTQMPLKWPVRLFTSGTLLFSGNCFLYVLTGVKAFAMIVPLGGVLLMVGWGWFIWELAFFTRRSL